MIPKLISSIDKAVCLTLDKRIKYAKEIQKSAIEHDINLELFIAGDGSHDVKYDYIDAKELPSNTGQNLSQDTYTWHKSPNMYNIFLCEREIIRRAYYNGCEVLLLMEDDAVFMDNFDKILQEVDGFFNENEWDIIYLGSYSTPPDGYVNVRPYVHKLVYGCGGFHGVLIKRRLLEIAKDFDPRESMDGMFCHSGFQEKYNCYRISPPIICQMAGPSSTSGDYLDYERIVPTKFNDIFGWFTFDKLYKKMVDENDDGIFVELGAFQGRSAIWMAEYIQITKKKIDFYCVDLWPDQNQNLDMFHPEEMRIAKELPNSLYHTFIQNLIKTKTINNINIIRDNSWEAAKIFEDNSVQFVDIDAGHRYEQIKQDLIAWYPKVKIGGVMAGHDFFGDVERAVLEILPSATRCEYDNCSWFFRKSA